MMEDYNVPECYQNKIVFEILKLGVGKCKFILDNHKRGGIRYSKEKLIDIQT